MKVTDVKEFRSWCAKTTMLLARKIDNKCVQSHITKAVTEIGNGLRPFLTSEKPNTWVELQEIVDIAVSLDLEVRKSRAIFEFKLPCDPITTETYGFPYDRWIMESQEKFPKQKNGMMVELVVTPYLMKTGNADGDAYDIETILSKSISICTETRRKIITA